MKPFSLVFLCLVLLQSCKPNSDDDVSIEIECPKAQIVSTDRFDDFEYQECAITYYKITGNSMRLSLAISGCNFQRNYRFIVDEAKAKSLPPQQRAQLVFEPQACQAFFEYDICFDISAIERPTILKLPNSSGVTSIEIN